MRLFLRLNAASRQIRLHVKGAPGLRGLLLGAVADQSGSLGQAQVKGQQGPVLHADGSQSGAIDLQKRTAVRDPDLTTETIKQKARHKKNIFPMN